MVTVLAGEGAGPSMLAPPPTGKSNRPCRGSNAEFMSRFRSPARRGAAVHFLHRQSPVHSTQETIMRARNCGSSAGPDDDDDEDDDLAVTGVWQLPAPDGFDCADASQDATEAGKVDR